MVGTSRESALSEVIGFILIIAILVVVASLYVTYVVPSQGREAEIAHMTYIKNQFVDFKMAMDSLWINSQVNTSLSQNIEMGTLGQMTQGQFTFLPLTQPVGSAGIMNVSNDASEGTIRIVLNGYVKTGASSLVSGTSSNQVEVNPDIYTQMQTYQALYPTQVTNMILVPCSDALTLGAPTDPNDFNTNQNLSFNLLTVIPDSTSSTSSANWTVNFNLTRVPSFYVPNTTPTGATNSSKFLTDKWVGYMKADYRYDLIMGLIKKNQTTNLSYPVFQNFTLNSSSKLPGNFWVNLQDPAYGLDASGPMKIRDSKGNIFNGSVNITRNWDVPNILFNNITETENVIRSGYSFGSIDSGITNMGKFSYQGENYYWVPQEYYYQMGGVFLNQSASVPKLLPLISLGVVKDSNGSNIPSISITKLIISRQNANVAGSTSVLVSSSVSNVRRGILTQNDGTLKYIAPITDNARNITIIIGNLATPQVRQMWSDSFNASIRSANLTSGFYNSWVTNDKYSANNTVVLGLSNPECSTCNIFVDYSEVNASVILQPIGWQGS